jgi:hypothetical protein
MARAPAAAKSGYFLVPGAGSRLINYARAKTPKFGPESERCHCASRGKSLYLKS